MRQEAVPVRISGTTAAEIIVVMAMIRTGMVMMAGTAAILMILMICMIVIGIMNVRMIGDVHTIAETTIIPVNVSNIIPIVISTILPGIANKRPIVAHPCIRM